MIVLWDVGFHLLAEFISLRFRFFKETIPLLTDGVLGFWGYGLQS